MRDLDGEVKNNGQKIDWESRARASVRAPSCSSPRCCCHRSHSRSTLLHLFNAATLPSPPSTQSQTLHETLAAGARLLGEIAGGTTDAELSGFEELFAGLREEEEKAIAAAHEQEMVAILDELGEGGTTPKRPPPLSPPLSPLVRARGRSTRPTRPPRRASHLAAQST